MNLPCIIRENKLANSAPPRLEKDVTYFVGTSQNVTGKGQTKKKIERLSRFDFVNKIKSRYRNHNNYGLLKFSECVLYRYLTNIVNLRVFHITVL